MNIFKRIKSYYNVWKRLQTEPMVVLKICRRDGTQEDRVRCVTQDGISVYRTHAPYAQVKQVITQLDYYKTINLASPWISCFIQEYYPSSCIGKKVYFTGSLVKTLIRMFLFDDKQGLYIQDVITKEEHIKELTLLVENEVNHD